MHVTCARLRTAVDTAWNLGDGNQDVGWEMCLRGLAHFERGAATPAIRPQRQPRKIT
jgi:hypothetical protein